jgi:hypothetical protein
MMLTRPTLRVSPPARSRTPARETWRIGGWFLLPVEIKVVNRDDPTKKWTDAQPSSGPVHSGKETGDMVSWTINGLSTSSFSWSAEGPESKTGPSGTGKNEWKIANGDEDTEHDWIDWKPGKYKIKCTISSGSSTSSTAEFDQEVGVRTDDVLVIGWIDPKQMPLSTSGVQGALVQTLPDGGLSTSDSDTAKLDAALLLKHFVDYGVNSGFNVGLPAGISTFRHYNAFSPTDKTYALNWMFKYGGNKPEPPSNFTDANGFFSQQKVDDFANTHDHTLYKLLNHYQVRYLVSQDHKFKPDSLVHRKKQALIGHTKDPTRLYEISGIIDMFIQAGASFEGYPSNGAFPGMPRANNTGSPVVSDTTSRFSNEGTPDQKGLDAEKKLTGQDQGYIWSTITFFSDPQHYSETTSPSTDQSLTRDPKPTEFYQGRINTQVYPTYWIYINGKKKGVQNQATAPSALFPNTDEANE